MKTDLQVQDIQLDSLINQGQYARLTKFLLDLQTAIDPTDQSDLKNITATALQICLFCQQCQMEMDWHRKADHEVRHRLNELDGQLETLLNLIVEYETQKETQHPAMSVSVTLLEDRYRPVILERPNIWQRIRDLFNFKPKLSYSDQLMTKIVVNTSFPSGVEKGKCETNWENPAKHLRSTFTTQADTLDPSTTPSFSMHDPIRDVALGDQDKTPVASTPNQARKDASTVTNEDTVQNQDSSPSLVVYCLGPFRVFLDNKRIDDWASSKGKAIFKYLVLHRKNNVIKDILMDLFWPESSPDNARNNLNVAIHGLRKAFRAKSELSVVELNEGIYRLNPKIKVWVDVETFEGHLQTAHRLEGKGNSTLAIKEMELAANLYRGDFLVDDIYDEWTILTRERLRLAYLDILDQLSQISFSKEDYSASAMLCQMILDRDSCREDAHRRLIRCYSHQGQRHLALRQFQLCVEALHNELDIKPDPTTIQLVECIREQEKCLE